MISAKLLEGKNRKQIKAMETAQGVDWEKPFYFLLDENGETYVSNDKGKFTGNTGTKIYSHLDCSAPVNEIAKYGITSVRVFFKDEETAIKAGFRPCYRCMRKKYLVWKEKQENKK